MGGRLGDVGDSGFCALQRYICPVERIVGKNTFCDAMLVSALWAVLKDMSSTIGETVKFL